MLKIVCCVAILIQFHNLLNQGWFWDLNWGEKWLVRGKFKYGKKILHGKQGLLCSILVELDK